ncbi:MAG TPA: hydroxymethylbilane synthase, partial [Planctomycetaceae bacterium]|nr:hydroxymethylbilane synthase [Planctomycetaceae bacterium]
MSHSDHPAIRIATRASRLAMWQAEHVSELLASAAPERAVEIIPLSTIGDRDKTEPLTLLGGSGTGVFTREVQDAVLDGRADIAVHSLKDLPTETVEELTLAAVPNRGAIFDVLVLPANLAAPSVSQPPLAMLSKNARIGTGSPRRKAQLLHARP